jgi:hypothetical protein
VLSAVQVVLAARSTSDPASLQRADAVAIDARLPSGSTLGTDLSDRLATAVDLVDQGLGPRLVVVLFPRSDANEKQIAAAARGLLDRRGLAHRFRVLAEPSGTDGLRSIASAIGGAKPTAIVVTDAIDELWTKGAATSAGIIPEIASTPESKVAIWQEVGPLVRESTGVAAGRIIGDLRAYWAAD